MSKAMESQLRLIAVFTILANLSLFVYTARGQIGSSNSTSCIELNNTTEELMDINCTDKIVRYFFNSSSNACNPILTCTSNNSNSTSNHSTSEELGHSSLIECNTQCGLSNNNKVCPNLIASNIVHTTCTGTSTKCAAYYKCQPGYYFFGSSNVRNCNNGIWSPEPICRKIGIYHNGKLLRQKEVINIEGSSETVECRVSPSPLPTDTKLEWTESRHIIQGQWNDNKTSYQLIVDGSQGSFPKEYHCNATNGKNSMTTSVIFNVTSSPAKQPKIIYSITSYSTTNSQVEGRCLCEGHPKPIVKWFLDDNEITDALVFDAIATSTDHTLSMLTIANPDPVQHSGTYHCQCISGPYTVNGYKINVPVPSSVQTVSRRRRSTTRAKATTDTPLCNLMLSSSTETKLIVGKVKRYLLSEKILHVKVSDLTTKTTTTSNKSEILKVQLQNDIEAKGIKRHSSYLMLITSQSNGLHMLQGKSLYSKELLTFLQKHCHKTTTTQ